MEWQAIINFCTENDKVISAIAAIATVIVMYQTVRATKASRRSAFVAFKALEYSQRISLREAFESRYSLLLDQHNQHLKNVCDFIASQEGDTFKGLVEENKLVHNASKVLMGHAVISPYMRILYHLLKHIDDNYYENGLEGLVLIQKKKEYTSPLRSLIRNDVLYLVALNSIITKTNIDTIEKDNGYGRYQKLLHNFDFFEHAIFYNWKLNQPSGIGLNNIIEFFNKTYIKPIKECIYSSIYHNNYNSDEYFELVTARNPTVIFSLLYTYKNPAHDCVHKLFNEAKSVLYSYIHDELDDCQKKKEKKWHSLKNLVGKYIDFGNNSGFDRAKIEMIEDVKIIINDYKTSKKIYDHSYGAVTFYYNDKNNEYYSIGVDIESEIKSYIYNGNLLDLKNAPDRDEKITSLVGFALKNINAQSAQLKQLRYDAP